MPVPLSIFISHSHQDDVFGERLVLDLRQKLGGETAVWYDSQGGLQGGDAWWRKIEHEISQRTVFLVILSPDSVASPWVNDEIDLAWRQKNTPAGKRIIPILLRTCDIRPSLQTLQMVSFAPPKRYEDGFRDLLNALGLSAPSIPFPVPRVEQMPISLPPAPLSKQPIIQSNQGTQRTAPAMPMSKGHTYKGASRGAGFVVALIGVVLFLTSIGIYIYDLILLNQQGSSDYVEHTLPTICLPIGFVGIIVFFIGRSMR